METSIIDHRGWHRAHLLDTDRGVRVTIGEWTHRDGRFSQKIHSGFTVDAPFHIVCDRLVELLTKLPDLPAQQPT